MEFLNVDLEVGSRTTLAPLIAAMHARRSVFELFVGEIAGLARAHYELGGCNTDADATTRGLTRLVARLPPAARRCWDRARVRDFNIGIQAGAEPRSFEVPLAPATVAAVAALGGRIVVTVYAPEVSAAPPGRAGRRPAARSRSAARAR